MPQAKDTTTKPKANILFWADGGFHIIDRDSGAVIQIGATNRSEIDASQFYDLEIYYAIPAEQHEQFARFLRQKGQPRRDRA